MAFLQPVIRMVLLDLYVAKGIFLVVLITSYTEFASRQALRRQVLFLFVIAGLGKCHLFLEELAIK